MQWENWPTFDEYDFNDERLSTSNHQKNMIVYRLSYIKSLEKPQLVNGEGDSKNDYFKLINSSVDRSLNINLKAIENKTEELENEKLLKIGELAKSTNQTVPTIRHWTKEGLLQVAEVKESGYQMYSEEMFERVQKIQEMKKDRMTLTEIKKNLK